jgi:hypothetical protein
VLPVLAVPGRRRLRLPAAASRLLRPRPLRAPPSSRCARPRRPPARCAAS